MERVDTPTYRLADDEALALIFRHDGSYLMISGGIWNVGKVLAALEEVAKRITHREIIYSGHGEVEYRDLTSDEVRLLAVFGMMSEEERANALAIHEGFISPPDEEEL